MKSYISRKFPLETRTTDQTLELRSVGVSMGPCWKRSFTIYVHARKRYSHKRGICAWINCSARGVERAEQLGEVDFARYNLAWGGNSESPDQLETKLDLAGSGGCLVQPNRKIAAVEIKRRVVLTKGVQESRREEVTVIQDVKELRPELDIKGFRDLRNREIFENGEVNRGEARSIEFIASGSAEHVGAILHPGRRGSRSRIGKWRAPEGVCGGSQR